jgi:RimJ/RimL family protein N-acetyltransferase
VALRQSIADPSDPGPALADWHTGLPELSDGRVTVRQLRQQDGASLTAHLSDDRVGKYITPCPSTASGFARFIRWTHTARRHGRLACFGIVPFDMTSAVGVIEIWPIERDFSTAEWGFALGATYWGTGVFVRSARLVLDAVFSQLGVYRLEARAVDTNGRGNGILQKLGAKRDGVLRGSFRNGLTVGDHVMWSILAPEWHAHRHQRINE